MRTTVVIADELLDAARRWATDRGVTLGAVMEAALRRELAHEPGPERPPVPVFRGGRGPRPGVDLTSNRALHETLHEDTARNRRR